MGANPTLVPEIQYPGPVGIREQDIANRVAFSNLFYLRQRADALESRILAISSSLLQQQATAAGATGATGAAGAPGAAGTSFVNVGTHVIRLTSYPPDPSGAEFFETDRKYLYIVSDVTGVNLWNYSAGVSYGTHANRWADLGATDAGALYFETDRNALYEWSGSAWVFRLGMPFRRTQAQLAALAATLGANDAGFRAEVTDYSHTLEWTGAAWTFADGDSGSGYVQPFIVAPTGGTWHICDGTAGIKYLKGDGTTGSLTVPTLTGSTYIKAGGYSGPAVNAAINPTWTAGSKTDDESAHTHQVDPPPTASGNESADTTVDNTLAGSTVSVAANPHTHSTDIAPFTSAAGSAHHHNLSDANAKLNKIGDATWVPENMGFDWYFRQ